MTKWRLSAFGDEISNDLNEQLRVLQELQIGFLELRGVWGKNVLHLTDEELATIRKAGDNMGIAISAIGSPVGKSPITQPFAQEMQNLQRIFVIAEAMGTRWVRVFSFYPPETSVAKWSEEQLVEEATARLGAMTETAARAGMQLLLENEHGIVGDSVARCIRLLDAINSPHLAFAWDPANFVHVGEASAVSDGWASLGPRTRHVHVKDYSLAARGVRVAGEGDGQFDLLLTRLREANYEGFLALEPHLVVAGHSSGFSGPEGMARAAAALRTLLAKVGVEEQIPEWAKG
jgi:sugar phosphate isomerase/epimerase